MTSLALNELASVRSIVVFAAHPDDIESWCAGTIALAADAGAAVHLVIATSGESGASVVANDDLGAAREAEARVAARTLGVREPVFLRLPDGGLAGSEGLLTHCRDGVARYHADLVLTFDPYRPWSVEPHPDHVAIGRAGIAAGGGVAVWLYSTRSADRHVDITLVFERKVAARLAHRSQTADPVQLRADWEARSQSAGAEVDLARAEAFRAFS